MHTNPHLMDRASSPTPGASLGAPESPTTVVISGDLIAPIQGGLNTDLWGAVDLLKNQYTFKIQ